MKIASGSLFISYRNFILVYTRISMLLQARSLLKKIGEEVPIELLNNIGVLQFERGEFEVCQSHSLFIYLFFR